MAEARLKRREFLTRSTAVTAIASLPVSLSGCLNTDDKQGVQTNPQWQELTANLEAAGLYSMSNPGPWAGKEAGHTPKARMVSATECEVTVNHVTKSDHFIQYIYLKDPQGRVVAFQELQAADSTATQVKVRLALPAGVPQVIPYAFCNLHNNWVGDPVDTSVVPAASNEVDQGSFDTLSGGRIYTAESPGIHAQRIGTHVPVATRQADGTTVVVTVPHVMQTATEEVDDHWITLLALTGYNGVLIGTKRFRPGDPAPSAEFRNVPPGPVTPWSHCNLHGMWRGAEIP